MSFTLQAGRLRSSATLHRVLARRAFSTHHVQVLRLRVGDVHALHRLWILTACLDKGEQSALCQPASVAVEIQVVTQTVWRGTLPSDMVLQSLEDMWRSASDACGLPPLARVFSGPFPCPVHATIAELLTLMARREPSAERAC